MSHLTRRKTENYEERRTPLILSTEKLYRGASFIEYLWARCKHDCAIQRFFSSGRNDVRIADVLPRAHHPRMHRRGARDIDLHCRIRRARASWSHRRLSFSRNEPPVLTHKNPDWYTEENMAATCGSILTRGKLIMF